MSTPLIGIQCRLIEYPTPSTPAHGVPSEYIESVFAAGGHPILLPLVGTSPTVLDHYVSVCDGFVFTGGIDIQPQHYGETPHETVTRTSKLRDEVELHLFQRIHQARKPALGICRGLQLINVALGGTLEQDIPSIRKSKIPHACKKTGKSVELHEIDIVQGSRLASVVGSTPRSVNSLHHQCIKKLGRGLTVSARCPEDDVIEGVESLPNEPWLIAVQWHPEVLWRQGSAERLWHLELFKALVHECSESNR